MKEVVIPAKEAELKLCKDARDLTKNMLERKEKEEHLKAATPKIKNKGKLSQLIRQLQKGEKQKNKKKMMRKQKKVNKKKKKKTKARKTKKK